MFDQYCIRSWYLFGLVWKWIGRQDRESGPTFCEEIALYSDKPPIFRAYSPSAQRD